MTLRESYIQGIIALLQAIPAFPATVERSVSTAFSREESPVLVVHRGGEQLENSVGSEADRQCEILVSVVSRGAAPDAEADDIMELAHPAIMRFAAAGLQQIEELGTNAPVYASNDSQACMLTTRYRISYSTDSFSLSE